MSAARISGLSSSEKERQKEEIKKGEKVEREKSKARLVYIVN